VDAELARPQVLVMGRVTSEVLGRIGLSPRMLELPKLVVSRTLEQPPTWPNARLVRDAAALRDEPAPLLRTIGSLTLVQSLFELGLVDRFRLLVFPLTLGDAGREPVFERFPPTRFSGVTSRVLDGRLVELEYRR
jgi:dihydrofolate reductase